MLKMLFTDIIWLLQAATQTKGRCCSQSITEERLDLEQPVTKVRGKVQKKALKTAKKPLARRLLPKGN